jgi:hypothetical protein
MRIPKALAVSVVTAGCGIVYVTIWQDLSRLGDLYGPLQGPSAGLLFVALAFFVTLVLLSVLVNFSEWGSQVSIPFFLVGVAVGVVIDALTDKTMDRNIFPIEAVVWCAIFGPALGFGKELGAWLKKRREKRTDDKSMNSPAGSL